MATSAEYWSSKAKLRMLLAEIICFQKSTLSSMSSFLPHHCPAPLSMDALGAIYSRTPSMPNIALHLPFPPPSTGGHAVSMGQHIELSLPLKQM